MSFKDKFGPATQAQKVGAGTNAAAPIDDYLLQSTEPKRGKRRPGITIKPGTILGRRYVLLTQIAVGGMGEVWQARDNQTQNRVAVKVLRPELAGQEPFLARLRVEAKNASNLNHKNLCQVLDSGEENGVGWVVMELVNGMPMTDLLSSHRILTPQLTLSILQQTALALQVVHDALVVHRDIKPANIMITKDGDVKLTDFGISRARGQITLTQPGMVMGTAQYLPPEQAMGHEATGAGDLYALGVIAYEALVGKRPFTGSSQVEIAAAHVNEPVPPLPDTVPKPVADLVMNLLEKDPAKRPASAAALATKIDEVVEQMALENAESRPNQTLIRAELLVAAKEVYSAERFAEYNGQMPSSFAPRRKIETKKKERSPRKLNSGEAEAQASKKDSISPRLNFSEVPGEGEFRAAYRSVGSTVWQNLRKGISALVEWIVIGLSIFFGKHGKHGARKGPSWQHTLAAISLIVLVCFVLFLLIGYFVSSLSYMTQASLAMSSIIPVEDSTWLKHLCGA